jgi:hypothetical protein
VAKSSQRAQLETGYSSNQNPGTTEVTENTESRFLASVSSVLSVVPFFSSRLCVTSFFRAFRVFRG